MFIKLKNCLEHEDVDCSFGDVEYFILTEKIEKMRAFKESTDRFNNYDETYFRQKPRIDKRRQLL